MTRRALRAQEAAGGLSEWRAAVEAVGGDAAAPDQAAVATPSRPWPALVAYMSALPAAEAPPGAGAATPRMTPEPPDAPSEPPERATEHGEEPREGTDVVVDAVEPDPHPRAALDGAEPNEPLADTAAIQTGIIQATQAHEQLRLAQHRVGELLTELDQARTRHAIEFGRLESGALSRLDATIQRSEERESALLAELRDAHGELERAGVQLELQNRRLVALQDAVAQRDARLAKLNEKLIEIEERDG